jgi:hypothetical protein
MTFMDESFKCPSTNNCIGKPPAKTQTKTEQIRPAEKIFFAQALAVFQGG